MISNFSSNLFATVSMAFWCARPCWSRRAEYSATLAAKPSSCPASWPVASMRCSAAPRRASVARACHSSCPSRPSTSTSFAEGMVRGIAACFALARVVVGISRGSGGGLDPAASDIAKLGCRVRKESCRTAAAAGTATAAVAAAAVVTAAAAAAAVGAGTQALPRSTAGPGSALGIARRGFGRPSMMDDGLRDRRRPVFASGSGVCCATIVNAVAFPGCVEG